MEKNLARFFSILFHPLIMIPVGMLIILNSGTSLSVVQPEVKRVTMVVVLLFTSIFPAGLMIMLYLTRMIGDFEMKEQRERTVPLALTVILMLFIFFVMKGVPQLTRAHSAYLLSPAVSLFLTLVINHYMKPSLHLLGLGSLAGMLLVVMVFFGAPLQTLFIITILCSGITASSQLILALHSPIELLTGFLTGLVATFLVMVAFLLL